LYDLGQLRELYRELSLLGLAVSLLAISLAYQRYVFNDLRARAACIAGASSRDAAWMIQRVATPCAPR